MQDDIFEIKLLPTWSHSSVLTELKSALGRSHILQAGKAVDR